MFLNYIASLYSYTAILSISLRSSLSTASSNLNISTHLLKACNCCCLLRHCCSETHSCLWCVTVKAECHEWAQTEYMFTLWKSSHYIIQLMKIQMQSYLSEFRYFQLWHIWWRVHCIWDSLQKPIQWVRQCEHFTEFNWWYLIYSWSCKSAYQLYCILFRTAWFISFAHRNSATRFIWDDHRHSQINIHGKIWYDFFLRCCSCEIVTFSPYLTLQCADVAIQIALFLSTSKNHIHLQMTKHNLSLSLLNWSCMFSHFLRCHCSLIYFSLEIEQLTLSVIQSWDSICNISSTSQKMRFSSTL